jgi:hypothetical protein
MSGIEIVGIVLGALPIMITGIEKYSDGLSAARRLLHPRKELRNMHRAIRTELQVFRNTAIILLHFESLEDTWFRNTDEESAGVILLHLV